MFRVTLFGFGLVTLSIFSQIAQAKSTINIGYHNPPGAHYGVNYLYWGSQWGFEAGVGWLNLDGDTEKDDSVGFAASGALSLKYFFSQGTITPYLQGGFAAGTKIDAGEDSDASAGLGGGFAGLGLLLGSPLFYVYGGWVGFSTQSSTLQGGIGFGI